MSQPKLLIIGGSGFVSGTLAREAVAQGWDVWALTRGQRPMPAGVRALVADRKNPEAFKAAVARVNTSFDLVVDCIAYEPTDVKQDIESFAPRGEKLVLISTDFVYHPTNARSRREDETRYVEEHNYGGNKRRCELELINCRIRGFNWTIFRPCHIYGPGSLLGCLPPDNRDAKLIEKIKAGQTLPLVGTQFLQQPIFVRDLAKLILSVRSNPLSHRHVFNAAGPELIKSVTYYEIIADMLGVALKFEELPIEPYLKVNPDKAPFLCHRVYDLDRLKAAGLAVPSTSVHDGMREHVRSLLA